MNIVSSVHEGFHNVPKLYGSEVREPAKVTSFGSGMKEAGKESYLLRTYGLRSWLTDLHRVSSTVITMASPVWFVSPWKVPRRM
jgi:hypothetical protein